MERAARLAPWFRRSKAGSLYVISITYRHLEYLNIVCITTHVKSSDVIKALEKAGWAHVRTTGSHHHFKHLPQPGLVTVPHPKKDLPIGTLRSIEKQSALKLR